MLSRIGVVQDPRRVTRNDNESGIIIRSTETCQPSQPTDICINLET